MWSSISSGRRRRGFDIAVFVKMSSRFDAGGLPDESPRVIYALQPLLIRTPDSPLPHI